MLSSSYQSLALIIGLGVFVVVLIVFYAVRMLLNWICICCSSS